MAAPSRLPRPLVEIAPRAQRTPYRTHGVRGGHVRPSRRFAPPDLEWQRWAPSISESSERRGSLTPSKPKALSVQVFSSEVTKRMKRLRGTAVGRPTWASPLGGEDQRFREVVGANLTARGDSFWWDDREADLISILP